MFIKIVFKHIQCAIEKSIIKIKLTALLFNEFHIGILSQYFFLFQIGDQTDTCVEIPALYDTIVPGPDGYSAVIFAFFDPATVKYRIGIDEFPFFKREG